DGLVPAALNPYFCPILTESYFGDSFCTIHAIQDVTSFHLSLQFKTSRRSGLLLLAAGVQDYLSLELLDGQLRVRLNLGSGEQVLPSPLGLQLNNLLEHTVAVTRQDSSLTMLIDNLYSSSLPLPQHQEDLNIDLGVFLGGTGGLQTNYLDQSIPPLRGCMSNVKFESHNFDILRSEPSECVDTKDLCSSEFEAGGGETISFISPDSFISFPTWELADTRTLEFLIKTTIEDALLVFHAGHKEDFIALGLAGGYLKGLVDLGNGIVGLDNVGVQLDDDQWHRVKIQLDQGMFVMNVDSQASSVPLSESASLDLTGNLYVGGIAGKMKEMLRNSGPLLRMEEEITSESFIGCLGEIKVNQRDRSLRDALVTKDVHVSCEGEEYDYSTYGEDVEKVTTASPVIITHADIKPVERHCYPTNDTPEMFRNITKLLDITPLLVPEGGEAFLDISNLHPTIDLNKAGIRQSQIIFTLQKDPLYGSVDMNINSRKTKKFTLLDIINKKIMYIHDGNERYRDQIQLEVVMHSYSQLPECLKNPQQYILPVEIIPVNDIPQLSGGDFPITQHGRTRLSPQLIKIVDSDTRCDDLVVMVTSEATLEEGYLENAKHPGRSIDKFTCRQLKDGDIYYIHKSGRTAGLTLQVSDGHSVSPATTISLAVTQPSLSIVTNTGILMNQGSNSTIGIQQLAVASTPKYGEVVYILTRALRFGELQILTSEGRMKEVMSFHQSDLEQGHLRYISTDPSDHEDIVIERIEFDVHLGQFVLQNNTFLVKITPSMVRMAKMVPLEMKEGTLKAITETELEAAVKGKNVQADSVRYVLVKAPNLGILQLLDKDLAEGDSFTQQDLHHSYLNYKVRTRRNVNMEDKFQFRVFADKQYSPVYTYPIKILSDPDVPVITNEGLTVLEGGESILNKEQLWVQIQNSTDFVYKITKEPQHGRLIRESPPGQPRFEGAIKLFSNEDLLWDKLIYKHDGSKTSKDYFTFLVFDQAKGGATTKDQGQEVFAGDFRISVQRRNDHIPLQVVDKTFNVVRNGQRLLTTDDILFHDDDSDFNDTQLVYMRLGILSGNIVSAEDSSHPLFRFTQADLRDKKVLFVHHGADRERFQLQVSDGVHKTTALLQVQASEPYLRVVNNSMVVIDHGSTKTLNTSLLSAESNVDIRDLNEIIYEVTSPPSNGRIIVSGIESPMFTQEDLRKGVVSYQHDDQSMSSKDSFSFRVSSKGLFVDATFRIKIFKQGYLSEPEVINNEVIISYEGEHTEITQEHLKVEQPDILPSEMVFTIRDPPLRGHVVMSSHPTDSTATPTLDYVDSFSQEDINQNRVVYVSMAQEGRDTFTVDVSNGFTSLEDLQIEVDIVPRQIPVKAMNFTISEGGSVAINSDILNITHPFYSYSNVDFTMQQPPSHGNIQLIDDGDDLRSFTWDEVKQGLVYYLHDSSETTNDSFTLMAFVSELSRSSQPITVSITVLPINDEPPIMMRNTGLELLVGEEAEITANMLTTEDQDTPPEELIYSIEVPSNGIVALKASPDESIHSFTQANLNNGEVIFIHKGSQSGEFGFTVTDGEHTSPLYSFIVTARELKISVETEGELIVYPGTRQAITSEVLKAVINEDGDEITYRVVERPHLGRVVSTARRNRSEEVSSFTQSELESGFVFYEHKMPTQPFWEVQDSMKLLLSSHPAPELEHTVPITVSYNAGTHSGASQLWRNAGLSVVRGQQEVIDSSKLDASNLLASVPESERDALEIVYEVKKFPTHGTLVLGGRDLTQEAPFFLQEDVEKKDLEYLHKGMDGTSDDFSFSVRLNPRRQGMQAPSGITIEETFNITAKHEDLSPPELVTLDQLLEVLQGSSTALTKKYLNTIDEDNTPNEVFFVVVKGPTNGRLVNTDSGKEISRFTQEDVNVGRVKFISDDSLADGFMEFKVSDGTHSTETHTLHIGILARTLILARAEEIQVRQGDDETPITELMLKATTGRQSEEEVLYKITNIPKYAAVMVDRQPTSAFTQKQIKEGRVSVRFIKSTSPRDSVALLARSRAANVSTVLNITTKPLVKLPNNPVLPRATTVLVDTNILDASALANKTRATPSFTITQQPRGTRFVRVGAGADGQQVSTFTQRDIEEGRVALEILNDTRAGDQIRDNKVQFLLSAHGVPPAEGTLAFRTSPYNASAAYGGILLKVPSDSSKKTPGEDSSSDPKHRGYGTDALKPPTRSPDSRKPLVSRRNNLWSILIPILVILLLLLLAGMLAYYLVRRNKTGKHDVQNVSAKPKNGEPNQETFRKTDAANTIPMSNVDSKEPDPELLQHCRTTGPALKKNQYWV
uniref:Chondroitin sulfate proteoglycan 4 n=1 Tax=Scleropages formosus TaxID=113540 RepID=A0A8C9VYX6_SCLFO